MFKKGMSGNPNGRPIGSKNRTKAHSAQIYNALIGSFKSGSFYVYRHIKGGVVFYVGKGSGPRAWDAGRLSRNPYWWEFVESIKHDYEVQIVAAGLSEDEALAIESALINANKPSCNIAQTNLFRIGNTQR